jgi:hypothetical protein
MTAVPRPVPLPRGLSDMSTLSSVLDDSYDFSDKKRNVQKKFDMYSPTLSKDDTVAVLGAFLEFLPKRGRQQIVEDIERLPVSDLRELRDYLVSSLLIPCKY